MALTSSLDWGALAPLRLRARGTALGALSGAHRSARRGAGVEFAGHRAYTPGDDLRFLDRHALMRHGTLALREFETETDRNIAILLDATASMGFRGKRAPAAKLAFAALVTAAVSYVALRGGDRISLDWLGPETQGLARCGGSQAFERLVAALEGAEARGDTDPGRLREALSRVARAPAGTVTLFVSDLVDLPLGSEDELSALAHGTRQLVALQVLDPDELDLPYDGAVRLASLEGGIRVDTDAPSARAEYLAALERLTGRFSGALASRGARLLRASTADDPVEVVRRILATLGGRKT